MPWEKSMLFYDRFRRNSYSIEVLIQSENLFQVENAAQVPYSDELPVAIPDRLGNL